MVSDIPIGSDRITIETSGSHVEVHGLTPDVQLAAMPRWTREELITSEPAFDKRPGRKS